MLPPSQQVQLSAERLTMSRWRCPNAYPYAMWRVAHCCRHQALSPPGMAVDSSHWIVDIAVVVASWMAALRDRRKTVKIREVSTGNAVERMVFPNVVE